MCKERQREFQGDPWKRGRQCDDGNRDWTGVTSRQGMSPRTEVGKAGSGISLGASVERVTVRAAALTWDICLQNCRRISVCCFVFKPASLCQFIVAAPRKLAGVNMGTAKE